MDTTYKQGDKVREQHKTMSGPNGYINSLKSFTFHYGIMKTYSLLKSHTAIEFCKNMF